MTRTLRSESGAPVADNQNSQTARAAGPVLLQDQHLIEKLARFNRERIPERVVHAVGSGAHGHFTVTNSAVSRYTRMRMVSEVGKRTPVFARFSTVAGSKGAPDSVRDPRGFALKFYTEDGNWDLAVQQAAARLPRSSCRVAAAEKLQRLQSESWCPGHSEIRG